MVNIQRSVHNFFSSKKIKLPEEWIEACIHWLQEEHPNEPQNITNAGWMCQKAYEQWLYTDLAELGCGCLPANLNAGSHTLQDDMVLQINSVQDVGRPSYAQLQQIRKDDTQNAQIDTDQTKPQAWEPKPNRLLLLSMTDGVTEIQGMEYTPLTCLSLQTKPGTKLLVKRGAEVRCGVLLLTAAHVYVLGGAVDALLVTNALENNLRRQLGLEEVERPAEYEELPTAALASASQASQYYPGTQSQRTYNTQDRVPLRPITQVNSSHHNTGPSAPAIEQSQSGSAADLAEFELDDELDADMEAALLEAESVLDCAPSSRDVTNSEMKHGINRNTTVTSANNFVPGLDNSSGSNIKNINNKTSNKSMNNISSSHQIGGSAPFITISPKPSKSRILLPYNPFVAPGPDNQPPKPVTTAPVTSTSRPAPPPTVSSKVLSPTSAGGDFDDDDFSEQDLSVLEEELKLVESQESQNTGNTSKKSHQSEKLPQVTSSGDFQSFSSEMNSVKVSPSLNLTPFNPNVSIKPNETSTRIPHSLQLKHTSSAPVSSIRQTPNGVESTNVGNESLVSIKTEDIHRASIKRPSEPSPNISSKSPTSCKVRKLNSLDNSLMPSNKCTADMSIYASKIGAIKKGSKTLSADNVSIVRPLCVSGTVLEDEENYKCKLSSDIIKNEDVKGQLLKFSERAKTEPPFTYLMFLPETPDKEQEFVVKAFVMTLLSRLEQSDGEWRLAVRVDDGTAGLDVQVHDQVLRKLIGVSVSEMRELKAQASTDPSVRTALSQKLLNCQRQLISLCSLITVRVSPDLKRPLLVNIAPYNDTHVLQLLRRAKELS